MEVRELDRAPSLTPLYAKAVIGPLVPGGGDELPGHALAIEVVEVDRDHLAAYCRVCGFRIADRLPPTYLHVVAFPLALALMTERSFPFPLLGMVHIANRIEHRRGLGAGERPALRVWAENMRPHRRGRQLDLVAEATLDGAVRWREVSTYLHRGEGSGDGRRGDERDEPAGEVVAVWSVPGDIGRRYAEVSGDRNPIHLHGLAARPFGFSGAIAHGMWMKARCLAALEGRLPEDYAATAEFRSPLGIPGRARVRLASEDGGWRLALERPDGERTHMTGSISAGAA
jgi:MaoC dehydratase-like protein